MFFNWLLLFVAISFFFYSYGFLDLNLTLTNNHFLLKILNQLQHLVYFQRSTSGKIYFFLLLGFHLTVFFFWFFYRHQSFSWKKIIPISLIFSLSYPFLSHDIFNYLFYAKELFVYHQNPHLVSPNHFQGDLWLRFMHWVHVPSPYGYVHTFLVLPIYLLGLGKFVLSLYFLKIFNWLIYLAGLLTLKRLSYQLNLSSSRRFLVQLAYTFNPLIIIEFLMNGHNDAWMMVLFLWGLVFLLSKKSLLSFLFFLAAGDVKYITYGTLPLFLILKFKSKLKLSSHQLISLISSALLIGVIFFWLFFKFQIWYSLWFLFLTPLFLTSVLDFVFYLTYSFYALNYYFFFISTGFWSREPIYFRPILFFFTLGFLFIFNRYQLRSLLLWYNQKHHDN